MPTSKISSTKVRPESRFVAAAAKRGDAVRLRELIAKGFCPNSTDKQRTALDWSIFSQSLECCQILLTAQADPNLPSYSSSAPCPPVVSAACKENSQILKAILVAGGNPDSINDFNESALALAAHFGWDKNITVLREAGARFDPQALTEAKTEHPTHCLALLEAWEVERSMTPPPGADRGMPEFN